VKSFTYLFSKLNFIPLKQCNFSVILFSSIQVKIRKINILKIGTTHSTAHFEALEDNLSVLAVPR